MEFIYISNANIQSRIPNIGAKNMWFMGQKYGTLVS